MDDDHEAGADTIMIGDDNPSEGNSCSGDEWIYEYSDEWSEGDTYMEDEDDGKLPGAQRPFCNSCDRSLVRCIGLCIGFMRDSVSLSTFMNSCLSALSAAMPVFAGRRICGQGVG